jgi:uncharacterized protein DUF3237
MKLNELTHLYSIELEITQPTIAIGDQLIVNVGGGTFSGKGLKGQIVAPSGDWIRRLSTIETDLDARLVLETQDGAWIYSGYTGKIRLPQKYGGLDRAERHKIDPSEYYYRIAPNFVTASKKYCWLNDILAVGFGRFTETGVAYEVYAIG